MTAHTHAASMLQYAQDAAETDEPWKRWEYEISHGKWQDFVKHPLWGAGHKYRRKPKTIRIGEYDVPEPFRGTLAYRQSYWVLSISDIKPYHRAENYSVNTSDRHVARGIVHLTEEAAKLHAEALLSFTKVVP
jgi:hypothetical protein